MRAFILYCTIFVIVCAVQLSSADIHDAIKKHGEECLKENGLDESAMEKFGKGITKDEDVPDNLKCFIHCLSKKSGYMNEDGKLVPETIRAELSEDDKEKFDKAAEKCNAVSGSSPCETAFLTFGCMMKEQS